MIFAPLESLHRFTKGAGPIESRLARERPLVRSDNSYVNPLAHATVIEIADIRPAVILVHSGRVLLDVDSSIKGFAQNTRQIVTKAIVSTHNVPSQPADESVKPIGVQRSAAHRILVVVDACHVGLKDFSTHTQPYRNHDLLV